MLGNAAHSFLTAGQGLDSSKLGAMMPSGPCGHLFVAVTSCYDHIRLHSCCLQSLPTTFPDTSLSHQT